MVANIANGTLTAGEWESFLLRHPQAHLLQTSTWGELKARHGWQPLRHLEWSEPNWVERPDLTIEVIQTFLRMGGLTIEKIRKQKEIERAKVGLKSVLILQSESSSSRAGSIGYDYYMLGRVRSLDEINDKIESTFVDSVLDFLRKNKFKDFTVVTIGPKELTTR